VNSEFDKGEILFQAKCPVIPEDTVESLAVKIHQLEHRYLPEIISDLVSK
jgi:phosphoribosylglycinamide formyltransferase-1